MRALRPQSRHPKAWKRTTVPGGHQVNAPDLIGRDFTALGPNQRRCGDITYVKCWSGWAYMATVIDLHSRRLVGWAIADHMRTSLVTDALDMALAGRAPAPGVVFHSDRLSPVKTPPASSHGTARHTESPARSARRAFAC